MIADFFEFLANNVFGLIGGLIGIFPKMPINVDELTSLTSFELVSTAIGWANWLIPFNVAMTIISLWCVAMMTYLGIKMAIRYSAEVL